MQIYQNLYKIEGTIKLQHQQVQGRKLITPIALIRSITSITSITDHTNHANHANHANHVNHANQNEKKMKIQNLNHIITQSRGSDFFSRGKIQSQITRDSRGTEVVNSPFCLASGVI